MSKFGLTRYQDIVINIGLGISKIGLSLVCINIASSITEKYWHMGFVIFAVIICLTGLAEILLSLKRYKKEDKVKT